MIGFHECNIQLTFCHLHMIEMLSSHDYHMLIQLFTCVYHVIFVSGADGKLQQTEVTQRDPTTGLVVPTTGCKDASG